MQLQATSRTSPAASTTSTSKDVSQLGKDDFLKLLMAQMRNQDPLKPMDDSQFMAQLTQFTMLERLQELEQRMATLVSVEQFGQANALVGKLVEGADPATGQALRGVVGSAAVSEGQSYVTIGDEALSLENVTRVFETDAARILAASGMIGREVAALDPATGTTVSGSVKAVLLEDGRIVLRVGDRTIPLEDIVSATGPESSAVVGASSLVGMEINAILQSNGQRVSGLVDSATLDGGDVILSVDGQRVRLSEVITVADS